MLSCIRVRITHQHTHPACEITVCFCNCFSHLKPTSKLRDEIIFFLPHHCCASPSPYVWKSMQSYTKSTGVAALSWLFLVIKRVFVKYTTILDIWNPQDYNERNLRTYSVRGKGKIILKNMIHWKLFPSQYGAENSELKWNLLQALRLQFKPPVKLR